MILRFILVVWVTTVSAVAQTPPNFSELAKKITGTNLAESVTALETMRATVYSALHPRQESTRKVLVSELLKLTDVNYSMQMRREALHLISLIGSTEAVPVLARLLIDQEVREEARMALERIGNFEASRALSDELRNSHGDFKHSLLYSLGKIGNGVAMETLAITTHATNQADVVATLDALSQMPGTDARVKVPDFTKFEEKYLPSLMSSWMTWLETQSLHKKIDHLAPIYVGIIKNAPQEHIVCAALIGMTRFYPQEVREPALIALNNPAYTVRHEAVRSLIQIGGDEESLKKLKEARESADKEKRVNIDKVLEAWKSSRPAESAAPAK